MPRQITPFTLVYDKGEVVPEDCCLWNGREWQPNTVPWVLPPANPQDPVKRKARGNSFWNNGWHGLKSSLGQRVAAVDIMLHVPEAVAKLYMVPQFNDWGEVAP